MKFFPSGFESRKEPLSLVPQCGACGLHKHVNSPFMKPVGLGKKRVLIVAEAPGEDEDREGEPLVGRAGMELSRLLANVGVQMRRDCLLTNALICRPMDSNGQNRAPLPVEIDYCQANLVNTIKQFDPIVVIPCGKHAVKALLALTWKATNMGGKKKGKRDHGVTPWVGWQIPSQKINAWICPTYHPSYLLRNKTVNALELHMSRHLRDAFSHKEKPYPDGIPDYASACHVYLDPRQAEGPIRQMCEDADLEGHALAFDFETTTLKPDGPHAEIICCSISDGRESHCYPWAEPMISMTRQFVRSSIPKIGANCKFEERWCRKFLRTGVCNWFWDTVLGAHWLDCRGGVCSVKFQAYVQLGLPSYNDAIEPFIGGRDSNKPNRLREVNPETLYHYCAMDSLLEAKIAQRQMEIGQIC